MNQELRITGGNRGGFTLVELVLVGGIVAVLSGMGVMSFFGAQGRVNLKQARNVLVSDLRDQQVKAMVGEVGVSGEVVDSWGVSWGSTSYTLYQGEDVEGAPESVVVELPVGVSITNEFAESKLEFLRGSGEVVDGVGGRVVMIDIELGEQEELIVNKLGVIID